MTTYIALLRGINVGGKNIIKMVDLREKFEKMGFEKVITYIQSGNVIFQSEIGDRNKIEEIIYKNLGLKSMVRSLEDWRKLVKSFPKIFANAEWKHNVILLAKSIDSRDIVDKLVIKKEIEEVNYAPGVLYWSARFSDLTKSTMIKLSAKKEYQEMTVRNTNTINKLLALAMELV